jgi:hypothetical protein
LLKSRYAKEQTGIDLTIAVRINSIVSKDTRFIYHLKYIIQELRAFVKCRIGYGFRSRIGQNRSLKEGERGGERGEQSEQEAGFVSSAHIRS